MLITDHAAAMQDANFELTNAGLALGGQPPVPQLKLARVAVDHPLDLADYVSPQADPPPAVHRSHLEFNWGMLGNDRLGDCGEAMAVHAVEAFHLDAGKPVPAFADQDAISFYSSVSGYDPANPGSDVGTDNHVLVRKWASDGLVCAADGSVHKIAASAFVDPHDQRLNFLAIWEFVVLFRAIGLPVTAQGQTQWQGTPSGDPNSQLGSWGYHDIPVLSYDGKRRRLVSWGMDMLEDESFDQAYADEGFVVITEEMLNQSGTSPAGVDWTRLSADAQKIAGG